jgi:Xaa-Pro dipeptidase
MEREGRRSCKAVVGAVMNRDGVRQVLQGMAERDIPQMVVSDPPAIFYLTGKWINPGERMLALYLGLTGTPKLFVNELFAVPEAKC